MFLDITIWDILDYFGVKPIDIVIITFIVIFIILILLGPAKIRKKCAKKNPLVNDEDTRRIDDRTTRIIDGNSIP